MDDSTGTSTVSHAVSSLGSTIPNSGPPTETPPVAPNVERITQAVQGRDTTRRKETGDVDMESPAYASPTSAAPVIPLEAGSADGNVSQPSGSTTVQPRSMSNAEPGEINAAKRKGGRPKGTKTKKARTDNNEEPPLTYSAFRPSTPHIDFPASPYPEVNAHNKAYYEFQWKVLNLCSEFYAAADQILTAAPSTVIAQSYSLGPSPPMDPIALLNEAKRVCDYLMANPKELITRPPPPDDAMIPSWSQTASIPPPVAPPAPLPTSHGSHGRITTSKYPTSSSQSQAYSTGQYNTSQSGAYPNGYPSSAGSYSQMSYQYGAPPGYYGYDMPSGQSWSSGSSYPAPHSTYKSHGAPITSTYGYTAQAPLEPPTQNAMMSVFRASDPHGNLGHGQYPAGSHQPAGSRQNTLPPPSSHSATSGPPPAPAANALDASRSSGGAVPMPMPARSTSKSGRAAAAPIIPGSSRPTTSPPIVVPSPAERTSATASAAANDQTTVSTGSEVPSPPWAARVAVTGNEAASSAQLASTDPAAVTVVSTNVQPESSLSPHSVPSPNQEGPLTSPWSTWESHRLRHLVESSPGQQGAKKGIVDWEWVCNQWGPTRTSLQIREQAATLGLQSTQGQN